jgi:pilus assembly protein CpaB
MSSTEPDRRSGDRRKADLPYEGEDRRKSDRRGTNGLGPARVGIGVNPARARRLRLPRIKRSRVIMLTVALLSGLGAAKLAGSVSKPTPVAVAMQAPAPVAARIDTDDVLVAASPLPLGKVLAPEDLSWEPWPRKLIGDTAIRRSAAANARQDMAGALVRSAFIQGEPMRSEKLVRANGSGILAAMLPSGFRAVAINIDTQGANSAGGFILPNDRVDVIRTLAKADPARQNNGEARFASETLLTNIRVLAIGQNIQEKNGERVVTGSNATLEVNPEQAELLVLAQRSGQISLALRSMSDASDKPAVATKIEIAPPPAHGPITIGVTRKGARHEYTVVGSQR